MSLLTHFVCDACGTQTRANLTTCPKCGTPMREEALPPDQQPSAVAQVGERLLGKDWLRIAFVVLTVVVVVGNSIGVSRIHEVSMAVSVRLAVTGVVLPLVFLLFPASLAILRFRLLSALPLRWAIFPGMLFPLLGLSDSGISETGALWLTGSYLGYLVVLWVVGDRTLGPVARRDSSPYWNVPGR